MLQKISESLESGDAARELDEQRRLEAAVKEKEAALVFIFRTHLYNGNCKSVNLKLLSSELQSIF